MANGDATAQTASSRDDLAERRLWFDYLSKLNDRALSRRALQPTSWVLIGILAALIYKMAPQVPAYLKIPHAVKQGLTVLAFSFDIVLTTAFAAHVVVWFCSGSRKGRILAERNRRATLILTIELILLIAALGVLHLGLIHAFAGPLVTRRLALGFGVFWSAVAFLFTLYLSTRGHKTAKRRAAGFWVTGGRALAGRTSFWTFVGLCSLGGAALYAVADYVIFLSHEPTGWWKQVGAGVQTLIILLILIQLWGTMIARVSESGYEELELDVVVGRLSAQEIRERFTAEILGPTVKEWLADLDKRHSDFQSKVRSYIDSAELLLNEIDAGRRPSKNQIHRYEEESHLLRRMEMPKLQEALSDVRRLSAEYRLHEDETQFLNSLIERWDKRSKEIGAWYQDLNSRVQSKVQEIQKET